MAAPRTRWRLALLAPLALLHTLVSSVLFLLGVDALLWIAVVGMFLVPMTMGLWLFNDRRALSRVLLSLWGPAGEVVVFIVLVLVSRLLGGGIPQWVLVAVGVGPLAVLLVGGLLQLRGAERTTRIVALALWLIAILGSTGAVPLADWLTALVGIDPLAGIVVLQAPALALGTWLGLTLAASLPEPDSLRTSNDAEVQV